MTVAERIQYIKADLADVRRGLQGVYRLCTIYNFEIEQIIIEMIEQEELLEKIRRLVYHDKDLQQFDLGFEITKAKDET